MNEYANVMTEDISFSKLTVQNWDSTKTSWSKETLSSESGPPTGSHRFSYKVRITVSLHHSTPKSSSATPTTTQIVRGGDISTMLPTSDSLPLNSITMAPVEVKITEHMLFDLVHAVEVLEKKFFF